jgi:hypothetical protein
VQAVPVAVDGLHRAPRAACSNPVSTFTVLTPSASTA